MCASWAVLARLRGVVALKRKPIVEKLAKSQQGARTDIPKNSAEGFAPIETREKLAEAAGLSHDTLRKIERIEAEALPRARGVHEG
ncbi:MAG TPA: hypothetical protein PKB14_22130 [Rubrivivax sp.]|nr:hypothetical protein [Rubrivivax sp.]